MPGILVCLNEIYFPLKFHGFFYVLIKYLFILIRKVKLIVPSLPRLLVVPPRLKIPYSLIFPKHIAFFKNTGYGVLEKDKKWNDSFHCFLDHWKEIHDLIFYKKNMNEKK
jgi:hypothetical protein